MAEKNVYVGKSQWDSLLFRIKLCGLYYNLSYGHKFDGRRGVVAQLYNDDGITWSATSYCSKSDQFNKKLGRIIALGRAFHKYDELGVEGGIVDKSVLKYKKPVFKLVA